MLKEINFRPATIKDIPNLIAIENRAYPHPWTQSVMEQTILGNYESLVVEASRIIIGYAFFYSVAGESHLLNICITPGYQGQGYGRQLLERVIKKSRNAQSKLLFLEVRKSNRQAVNFYLKNGFNQITKRYNYYPADNGSREDALLYVKTLSVHEFDCSIS